jgi:hypothetical protein
MGVALPPLRPAYAPQLLAAGVTPRLIQRSRGHPQLATTLVSLPLTHQGHAEAYAPLNALRHGLLPCPPCVRSAPPWRPHPWSATPLSPSHTARSAALSTSATVDPTATASLRANVVGDTPASIMPVATGTVLSGSLIQPSHGSRTPWTHSCPGRTASSPAPSLSR